MAIFEEYLFPFFVSFWRKRAKKQNVLTAKSIIKQCTHINMHPIYTNKHGRGPENGRFRKIFAYTHTRFPIWQVAWPVYSPLLGSLMQSGLQCNSDLVVDCTGALRKSHQQY